MTHLSYDTYRWIMAIHVFGVLMWVGVMFALLRLLLDHPAADASAQQALTATEKKTAILMDIGATISIVTAVWLLVGHPAKPFYAFKQGWMHVKLTLVIVPLLAVHGIARVKVKKFSRGEIKPLPSWILPLLMVAVLVIVVMAVRQPLK